MNSKLFILLDKELEVLEFLLISLTSFDVDAVKMTVSTVFGNIGGEKSMGTKDNAVHSTAGQKQLQSFGPNLAH
jgi:hypothetical protein